VKLTVHPTAYHKPNGDAWVMDTIDDRTIRGAFKPVCSDLIMTPDRTATNE